MSHPHLKVKTRANRFVSVAVCPGTMQVAPLRIPYAGVVAIREGFEIAMEREDNCTLSVNSPYFLHQDDLVALQLMIVDTCLCEVITSVSGLIVVKTNLNYIITIRLTCANEGVDNVIAALERAPAKVRATADNFVDLANANGFSNEE